MPTVRAFVVLGTVLLLSLAPASAETWFPPSTSWVAERLREAGCQHVRHDGKAVGGLLEGRAPGPTVVFSSNDPLAAIQVVRALGRPERGNLLAVFGSGVELKRGDYLLKVDFTDRLGAGQVALPSSGPSVDSFELQIAAGSSGLPDIVLASDLVLTLQNRAQTASALVTVQLEDFRDLPGPELVVVLSLRVFNPSLRERASTALEELSRRRLSEQGAQLLSVHREPHPESGHWPLLTQALGNAVEVLQEESGVPPSDLEAEDFGRPQMPSVTLRAGDSGADTTEAIAGALKLLLQLEPRPDRSPRRGSAPSGAVPSSRSE